MHNKSTIVWSVAMAAILAAAFPARLARGEEDDPLIDGKPISEVIKQLRSDNRGFQLRAAQALSKVATNDIPKVVPKLIPILKSERENDKFVAAQVLGSYGLAARVAVPDLLPMLEGTQYERNRAAAAKALGQILKDAQASDEIEKIVQALMRRFELANEKYVDVRRESLLALAAIGPAAKSCIPKLSIPLQEYIQFSGEPIQVHRAAAVVCGRMGPLAAEHLDRLISMMHGEGPFTTDYVDAIGGLGPLHDNVAPNIVDVLEKVIFSGWLGASPEMLTAFVLHGLAVLEGFGAKSERATDFLIRLLDPNRIERDPVRAIAVLKTLGAIGPAAAKSVPVIEKNCLKAKNADVVKAAEAALAKIGKK